MLSGNYAYNLIDLHNREIIGSAAGEKKDTKPVEKVLLSASYSLKDIKKDIKIFQTDHGNEYDNKLIDDILEVF